MAPQRIDRILIALMIFTALAPDIKFFGIQIKQLFELCMFVILPVILVRTSGTFHKGPVMLFVPLMVYFFYSSYYAFFTQDFFPSGDFGILKKPLILSLVRIVQFSLIFFAFNYLWHVLRTRQHAEWALKLFVRIAGVVAILTLLSYCVALATGYMSTMVYDTAPYEALTAGGIGAIRARGLFNEGGPYGLALVPILATLYLLKANRTRIGLLVPAAIVAAFLLSQSKAAVLAILLVCGIYTFSFLNLKRIAVLVIVGIGLTVGLIGSRETFLKGYFDYFNIATRLVSASMKASRHDTNIAFGRVAAFLIGPKMFLDRPVLGTGLGNYSLVRNNPDYLGPMPPVEGWDLPGMGVLTVLIEGGLVGFLILLVSYTGFYFRLGPRMRGSGMKFVFWIPLIVQCAGVQFYFAYHWLFLAMASLYLVRGTDAAEPEAGAPVAAPGSGPTRTSALI